MIQATSADIRDLKDLIQGLDKKVELGFSDLKGEVKTINSRLSNLECWAGDPPSTTCTKLPDLAEKVKEGVWGKLPPAHFRGELKNWKQIAIVVFTAAISGSIAWFVRGSGQ